MRSLSERWSDVILGGLQAEGAKRERLFWLLQLIGWTAVSAMAMVALIQIFGLASTGIILSVRMVGGIAMTCGLRWIYRRIPWRDWTWGQLVLVGFVLCIVAGTLESIATHRLSAIIINESVSPEVYPFLMSMGALLRSSVYVIWSLLYFGIKLWLEAAEARLRAAQSDAEARTSELRQLRAQVNPHFLFNALNSVMAEKDNPAAVERITQELAEYLRFSLRPSGDFQKLGDELTALEHYLRVEKARFEEKLIYTIEADPYARAQRVPVATVQPLLENAMKYGRLTSVGPLHLKVIATVDAEAEVLRVAVRNTGRWLEFDPERSHGIGLTNLQRRLELLFGVEANLAHSESNDWVSVDVEIPLAAESVQGVA
ncbi:sensor histidine kinase [Oleiharenicola lentus]|uniref:sensor histidine kinase n=1 Tax=Oleiharenicola lentus TaxID=2508720 RepID=UPI003F680AFD